MTATAVKQKPDAGIAVPVATLAVVGIAIALRAVGDNARALLHDVVALVPTLNIGGDYDPALAGAVAFATFTAALLGSSIRVALCRRRHDPSFLPKPTAETSAPQPAKLGILVALSLGLWWAI